MDNNGQQSAVLHASVMPFLRKWLKYKYQNYRWDNLRSLLSSFSLGTERERLETSYLTANLSTGAFSKLFALAHIHKVVFHSSLEGGKIENKCVFGPKSIFSENVQFFVTIMTRHQKNNIFVLTPSHGYYAFITPISSGQTDPAQWDHKSPMS